MGFGEDEFVEVSAHLESCGLCRAQVAHLGPVVDALPGAVTPLRAPPAIKDRLMAVVNSEAQLLAARGMTGGGRLVVAFQPHMYSRTAAFAEGFGEALSLADEVVVMDVYGAREDPVPGVTGALVAGYVTSRVLYEPSWTAVPSAVVDRAEAGDLVLTMGAGDITLVGPEVLRLLGGAPA